MTIICVDKVTFASELNAWRVPELRPAFISKNTDKAGRRASPVFFNDTEHLTNTRHWLAINAAMVYRIPRGGREG